jgi:hypothetical protein
MIHLKPMERPMAIAQTTAIADKSNASLYEGQIRAMIAELAYSYAEERGFDGGDPVEDWLRAESTVRERLAGEEENRSH